MALAYVLQRAQRLGDQVGYQIRLEKVASDKTRLLFCTTGIMLRRLQNDPNLLEVARQPERLLVTHGRRREQKRVLTHAGRRQRPRHGVRLRGRGRGGGDQILRGLQEVRFERRRCVHSRAEPRAF